MAFLTRFKPAPKRRVLLAAAVLGIVLTLVVAAQVRSDQSGDETATTGVGGSGSEFEPQVATLTYGPFTVPGGSDEEPGMITHVVVRDSGCRTPGLCLDGVRVPKPCEDCYITRAVPNLVDAETGETLNFDNDGMLHHVVNVNFSQPDITCPPSDAAGSDVISLLGAAEGGNQRWYASGNERTPLDLPSGYGVYVSPDDDWGLDLDLMNMAPEPREMALEYTYTWVPAEADLTAVTPLWFDVNNCRDSLIDVEPGYTDVEWDWTSSLTGDVVLTAGHVHDNGISIASENATTGETICVIPAGYDEHSDYAPAGSGSGDDDLHPEDWTELSESPHEDVTLEAYEGHLASMSDCDESPTTISEGDTVRLHAQYNIADSQAGHGANGHGHESTDHGTGQMGLMMAYVAE